MLKWYNKYYFEHKQHCTSYTLQSFYFKQMLNNLKHHKKAPNILCHLGEHPGNNVDHYEERAEDAEGDASGIVEEHIPG